MISRIRTLLAALVGRSRMEEEMSSELRFHMDAYLDDLVARGVPRAEAERRARVEFGGVEEVREECREARGLRWPDELRRNVRYAFRVLRRSPAFTVTALGTLALCIGANTAIFSVVDAVLLRPLPYPHPEKLALLSVEFRNKGRQGEDNSFDGESWFFLRDHASALDVAPFSGSSGANFASGSRAEYIRMQRVGARFFHALGVEPFLGREFTAEEDRPGGAAVAVLGYSFWKRTFGGDTSVLGRTIMLRGEPHVVVGVMPPEFRSDVPADVWTPLRPSTQGEGGGTNYAVVARLRPGMSWAQADTQMQVVGETIVKRLREQSGISSETTIRVHLSPFQRMAARDMRTPLLILWAAVGAVLLIGCVNMAGLLLAEGATRRREIATRIAMGGGRGAVVRQLLTESLVIAVCGSLLGVAAGYGGVVVLRRFAIEALGVWQAIEMNGRVLAAAGITAFVTSILFGLAPALEATRGDVQAGLVEGGGRGVAGSARLWPRRLLVVGEVALSFVLLIAAGLLTQTFSHLMNTNPGFDPAGVLTARISLQDARYHASRDMNRLFDQSLAHIRSLPGVSAAAVGLSLPYERPLQAGFRRLDGPHADSEQNYQATFAAYITPEYFRALRIPLLRGREFAASDQPTSAHVLIVNEAFVRRYLADQDPIGSHIGMEGASWTIVGVVGNVPTRRDFDALFEAPEPSAAVYFPATQAADDLLFVHIWFTPKWIVRTSGPSRSLIAGVTRAVEAVDPLLPFAGFETMNEVRGDAVRGHRFLVTLLGSLAGLALLLAAVGIYGLIANSVTVRTRELGIRLALGATTPQVVRSVAAPALALALAGVAVGAALSFPATTELKSLLYGIRSGDPVTFAAVAVILLGVAGLASWLPAMRITRLNPAETLRHE